MAALCMFRKTVSFNIIWAFLPVIGLTIVMSCYKFLGGINIFQIIILATFVSTVGNLFCYKFIRKQKVISPLKRRALYLLIPLGGLLNTIAYGSNFLISENGGSLSIAFPILMTCIIIFSVLIGIFFFREKLSLKNIGGLALILLGIFFVYV